MPRVHTKVSDRYAKALFRLMPADKRESVLRSLTALGDLFANKAIDRVLTSPVVQPELKAKVLATALGQIESEPKLIQFCSNIAKAGRTDQLPGITLAFEKLINRQAGIVKGIVTSASSLDDAAKKSLQSTLEAKLGKKPVLSYHEDPNILGGIVIELDNAKIDLSLKTKVDSLSKFALT